MDHQWLTQRIGVAWNQNRIIFNVVRSHDVTANTDIRVADTRVAADPKSLVAFYLKNTTPIRGERTLPPV